MSFNSDLIIGVYDLELCTFKVETSALHMVHVELLSQKHNIMHQVQ